MVYHRWFLAAICAFSAAFCFAQDKYLALPSLSTLYLSSDSGTSWTSMDILKSINSSVYLTSAARSQDDPSLIAVGTSFEGIFESADAGKTWKRVDDLKNFRPFSQGSGFYDEVAGLAYAGDGSRDLFFKLGFNGASFRYIRAKKTAVQIPADSEILKSLPAAFSFSYDLSRSVPGPAYGLLPREAGIRLPPGFPDPLASFDPDPTVLDDPARDARRQLAANKRGFYLNPSQASTKNLVRQLDFAVKNGLNSVVVDFKDDQGFLTYDSQVPLARSNKAILVRIDVPTLVKEAHARGLYLIARIVVFKDKQLFRYNKNAYAIWDKRTKKPWGVFKQEEVEPAPAPAASPKAAPQMQWVQTEYWVDPYSEDVRKYNIDIALEAQKLGADEIQFDYIRFPSDGNTADILTRAHVDASGNTIAEETMSDRVQALAGFLKEARQALSVPIGTDVFGFNAWARMSYLGQDIQALSYYVDVISPMMYPSHYARSFLGSMNYFDRASYIYQTETERARIISNNRVLIRPYVQAFLLGGELKFSDAQIYDYLNRQVKSSYQGGASGFTLWNNSGRYYMVDPKTFPAQFAVGAVSQ